MNRKEKMWRGCVRGEVENETRGYPKGSRRVPQSPRECSHRLVGKVLPPKISHSPTARDQPVQRVESPRELGEGAEPRVFPDPGLTVHVLLSLGEEGLDVAERALAGCAAVVLACPFCHPDFLPWEHTVEVLGGGDEGVCVHAVEVECDGTEVAAFAAGDEILDPFDAVGRGGDGGGDFEVGVDGFDVFPPEADGVTDAHGGLTILIGLIEAEDGLEVFAHDLGLPVADGLGAPHHGVPVRAVTAVAAVPCAPGVAPVGASINEGLHEGRRSIVPSETELATTGRASSAAGNLGRSGLLGGGSRVLGRGVRRRSGRLWGTDSLLGCRTLCGSGVGGVGVAGLGAVLGSRCECGFGLESGCLSEESACEDDARGEVGEDDHCGCGYRPAKLG